MAYLERDLAGMSWGGGREERGEREEPRGRPASWLPVRTTRNPERRQK